MFRRTQPPRRDLGEVEEVVYDSAFVSYILHPLYLYDANDTEAEVLIGSEIRSFGSRET